MGDDLVMAGRIDQKVNMRWPHRADLGSAHQLPDTAVHRDGIRHRQHRLHDEGAAVAGLEDAPHPGLIAAALRVIKALAVGLPDVERRARDRLTAETSDRADNVAKLTRGALRDIPAVSQIRRVMDVERSGYGRRRRAAGQAMVDTVHQHADADDVGGQDEFLALVGREFSGAGQPFDGGHPFLFGRLYVADEGMKVTDHGLHDLAQPGILHRIPSIEHDVGDVAFRDVGHGILLWFDLRAIQDSGPSARALNASPRRSRCGDLPARPRSASATARTRRA